MTPDASRIRAAILTLALPLLAACAGPGGDAIRAEFARAHPGAVIAALDPGEGDGDHVYYRIRFRVPPDTVLRETEWGFRRGEDGRWLRFPPVSTTR